MTTAVLTVVFRKSRRFVFRIGSPFFSVVTNPANSFSKDAEPGSMCLRSASAQKLMEQLDVFRDQ